MKIDLKLNNSLIIGSIAFMPVSSAFFSKRTASGFQISFPARVIFPARQPGSDPLLVENLAARFEPSGNGTEIGVMRFSEPLVSGTTDRVIHFVWESGFDALAFYERIREGKEPRFQVVVTGWMRRLFPVRNGQNYEFQLASFPADPIHEQTVVSYSREAWTNTLKQLGFCDSFVVEIPYPSNPPAKEWDAVWNAIRDARNAFDQGGSTGWRSAATHVRHALEKWQDIQGEEVDLGQNSPAKQRSKKQRLDNVRWHLYQLAHLSAHTGADDWTRDDAMLMLSTLCALVAVRKQ
jgi:hypothetical protein